MGVHEPRVRQLIPPSPDELQARQAEVEQWRAAQERKRSEERPARLAAISTGPALRDTEAAADCSCSCHPRAAEPELHDGGLRCPCQLAPEERAATMTEFWAAMSELWSDPECEAAADQAQAQFDERTRQLGVSARVQVQARHS